VFLGSDLWSRLTLSAQTEAPDQCAIALDVSPRQVVEQPAALADKLEQPASRRMVFWVIAKVFGERADTFRQHSHLDLGGAGVRFVAPMLRDYLGFGSDDWHDYSPQV
jgi:hypothetical protein